MRLTFRLPEELLTLIDERCKATKKKKSELILDALWFYLLNARD